MLKTLNFEINYICKIYNFMIKNNKKHIDKNE